MPTLNLKNRTTQVHDYKVRSTCEADKKHRQRSKVYTSTRWARLRSWKLQTQPLCEVCLAKANPRYTPAEECHHLDSFLNYPEGEARESSAFNPYNIISICHECHCRWHAATRNQPSTGQQPKEIAALLDSFNPETE